MEFSTKIIKQIIPEAVFSGVAISSKPFTYLNIAVPTGEISKSIDKTRTLYFPVYENSVELQNWYEEDFDRRPYVEMLSIENPDWVFVLDATCKNIPVKRSVIVPNLYEAIEKLYRYVLLKVNPVVVGITGSVGKTTVAAMLESVMAAQLKCLRLYSKRITPLILWASVINFLDPGIRVVIIEMALYEKGHVKWLAENITPDISVILNIRRMHIGSAGRNERELLVEKSEVIKPASIAVLNYDEDLIRMRCMSLKLPEIHWFSIENTVSDLSIRHRNQGLFNVYLKDVYLCNVTLFVATRLSVFQALATLTVIRLLKLDLAAAASAISKFHGRENRLTQKTIEGLKVIFDGETSYPARLFELSSNFYDRSALLIAGLYFGKEDLDSICENMPSVLVNFDLVRIRIDLEMPQKLKDCIASYSKGNIEFTKNLTAGLDNYSVVFYHHGGFFKKCGY